MRPAFFLALAELVSASSAERPPAHRVGDWGPRAIA